MMLKFIFLVVLMQSPWVIFGEAEGAIMGRETKDTSITQEVNSLFTSMASKSSPLYICDAENGGIEWLPPVDIDCNIHPEENDTKRLVNVTLYWSDVSVHKIKGFECVGIRTHIFGWKYLWSKVSTTEQDTYLDVSKEECIKMKNEKISPAGDIMQPVTDDTFETGLIQKIVPAFFGLWRIDIVLDNYKITETNIGISEADGFIRTTAYTTAPCHYNASFCKTSSGVLIWERSDVKTCRLLEGDSTECLFRKGNGETALTCPAFKLYMHDISSLKMCGHNFGTSSTGIYFLTREEGVINETLALPEEVRRLITRPRVKREISEHKVHPFEAEMKANLNYLHDTFNRGTSEAVWRLEKKFCEINKKQLELMSAFAQSGHPSLTTRIMYRDPKLRADYSGDLLTIFQCIEIFEYRFTERVNCTFEQPVEYIYEKKIYAGFITPITHTIVQNPTTRLLRNGKSCPKFFYKTPTYVVLLSGSLATEVNLPVMPQPEAAQNFKLILPTLAFQPGKKLNPTSDDDLESTLHVYRNTKLIQPNKAKTSKSQYELLGSWSMFSAFGDWVGNFFGSIYNWVVDHFVWGLYGIVIVIALFLANMFGCLGKAVMAPFYFLKSLLGVLSRACGCTRLAKK